MTLLVTHFRSRSIEQSTHLSVCSDAKKANLTGIQADLPVTPLMILEKITKRYD
ncbi:hypothetical protein ASZ90_007184 [hydrocarbon metagenome]|uniref:Uncharacterized protein n=1 Tax=hydrocarbon metagenome TaxID=938273 RepID=A0A0W8FRQ8_9ZZZZ